MKNMFLRLNHEIAQNPEHRVLKTERGVKIALVREHLEFFLWVLDISHAHDPFAVLGGFRSVQILTSPEKGLLLPRLHQYHIDHLQFHYLLERHPEDPTTARPIRTSTWTLIPSENAETCLSQLDLSIADRSFQGQVHSFYDPNDRTIIWTIWAEIPDLFTEISTVWKKIYKV